MQASIGLDRSLLLYQRGTIQDLRIEKQANYKIKKQVRDGNQRGKANRAE